ncbi:GNAT family acetyltransferase [uncultured Erythrobacter sp.]|uniref:GNAT family acetyltransferase n=1 Tax=uncultured Erythrobacter sp. TaxID=263913 RepID=UPI002617CC15|nr:GNAT family acetyltransferase [uncultured Erythrobacter sp.]
MQIIPYEDRHFAEVDRLWHAEFPNDPERNRAPQAIPKKLAQADGLFWVALDENGDVIGTIMAGWDGHRGWLYSVAVAPSHRNAGIGTALVNTALDELRDRGCIKVNLQVRSSNKAVVEFYRTLGFVTEPMVSMGRTL